MVEKLRSSLDESQKEDLENLLSTLHVMRDGMRDLVPDGLVTQKERTSVFELGKLVQYVLDLHHHELIKQGVAVYVDLPSDPIFMRARRTCLVQALEHVISNAIEWSKSGTADNPKVLIYYNEDTAQLLIGDSGAGVLTRDRERVFDTYFTRSTRCLWPWSQCYPRAFDTAKSNHSLASSK